MARDFPASVRGRESRVSGAETLASRALAALASTRTNACSTASLNPVDMLHAAVSAKDDSAAQLVLEELRSAGTSAREIIDQHIPDTARQLGAQWVSDDTSFADVSIGVSRLQQFVRNLGSQYEKDCIGNLNPKRALLILPEFEQHSLGTLVVANQLRRQGIFVEIALGIAIEKAQKLAETRDFSMVGLSISTEAAFRGTSSLISAIREACKNAPIILGGRAVEDRTPTMTSLGADLITQNTNEALDFCGLRKARSH